MFSKKCIKTSRTYNLVYVIVNLLPLVETIRRDAFLNATKGNFRHPLLLDICLIKSIFSTNTPLRSILYHLIISDW